MNPPISPWRVLFSAVLLFSQTSSGQCFFPNGTARTTLSGPDKGDYLPCNNNARASMCCALGRQQDPDQCLGNGLCKSKDDGVFWRESCTDKTWKSPNCVKLFIEGAGAINDVPLSLCDDGSWCAGANESGRRCCQLGRGLFILPNGSVSPDKPGSSTSSSQSSSATAATTSAAGPTTSPARSGERTSPASKVGIGVGLGLGAIALVLGGGLFLWYRRRRNKDSLIMPAMQTPNEDGEYHYTARTDYQRNSAYNPSLAPPSPFGEPSAYKGSAELDSQSSMLTPSMRQSHYPYRASGPYNGLAELPGEPPKR